MTKIYCQECGFQNTGDGGYCKKCGALLSSEGGGTENTISYSPNAEERELVAEAQAEPGGEGVFLVVRSGGDMAGASFSPAGDQTTIGRQQDSDIFLDDITVSRQHAMIVRRPDGYFIQDQGSLNGTYVNRVRVETQKLSDGDLLQIGKYRLTFIER